MCICNSFQFMITRITLSSLIPCTTWTWKAAQEWHLTGWWNSTVATLKSVFCQCEKCIWSRRVSLPLGGGTNNTRRQRPFHTQGWQKPKHCSWLCCLNLSVVRRRFSNLQQKQWGEEHWDINTQYDMTPRGNPGASNKKTRRRVMCQWRLMKNCARNLDSFRVLADKVDRISKKNLRTQILPNPAASAS